MAAITTPVTSFMNNGIEVDITMTYDDVTLKVASFDALNNGPDTFIILTINGASVTRQVVNGPNSYVPPGAGVTLLPPVKPGGSPRVPFDISIATP